MKMPTESDEMVVNGLDVFRTLSQFEPWELTELDQIDVIDPTYATDDVLNGVDSDY